MIIDNVRFQDMLTNGGALLEGQVYEASQFLSDVVVSDSYLEGIVSRVFARMPLADFCTLWTGVKDNLDYYKTYMGMSNSFIVNSKHIQDALWWLKDNAVELRVLYYNYQGWLKAASNDTKEAFNYDISTTNDIFDLLQSIWSNSCHGWYMPRGWNDKEEESK